MGDCTYSKGAYIIHEDMQICSNKLPVLVIMAYTRNLLVQNLHLMKQVCGPVSKALIISTLNKDL